MDLKKVTRAYELIDRAQDRDKWRAIVSVVMNISVP